MPRMLILLPILAMMACREEPSFDERYQETTEQIGQKADELEEELEKSTDTDATGGEAGCKKDAVESCF